MISKTQGWQHQDAAYDFCVDREASYLDMIMSTGKSKVICDVVVNREHVRTLILCPLKVMNVWPREFAKHAAKPVKVLVLDKGSSKDKADAASNFLSPNAVDQRVLVVNYESAWREPLSSFLRKTWWHCVVADECHPAGTMIDTPNGRRAIESLHVGNKVYGYDHLAGRVVVTSVLDWFSKMTKEALYGIGDALMTQNHPVFIDGVGYMPVQAAFEDKIHASHREESNGLREMRTWLSHNQEDTAILLQKLQIDEPVSRPGAARPIQAEYASFAGTSGRAREAGGAFAWYGQPIYEGVGTTKVNGSEPSEWLETSQWWQWETIAGAAGNSLQCLRLADGGSGSHEAHSAGMPNLLQNRHSQREITDWHRSGWTKPQHQESEREGCEEGNLSPIARLDNLEIHKLSDNDFARLRIGRREQGYRVFAIETGTGNYFADGVLVHNCHRAKAHNGKIGKFMERLRLSAGQRIGLSGTPAPHSPLDLFAQCRFLDIQLFGRWWTSFKARYAVTDKMFPSLVRKWINQEELAEKFGSISFHVGAEVLNLPPVIHNTRTITLCPKARKVYDELEEELIAEIDDGTITVSNALVKLLRLQQISSGFIQPDGDGPYRQIDTGKRDTLKELLEDLPTTEPVVVFAKFRHDLTAIHDVAAETGRRYAEISGNRKDGLTDLATMPADVDLVGVQIASGGVGIDLTRAAYCVYLSLGFSGGDYEQSLARVHRTGQTRTTNYFHLIAENTVDEKVYDALEKKKKVVEAVLHGLRSVVPENLDVAI